MKIHSVICNGGTMAAEGIAIIIMSRNYHGLYERALDNYIH